MSKLSVNEREVLEKEIIRLKRQNYELEQIAREATESVKNSTDLLDSMIKQRDEFLELCKRLAKELNLDLFS